MPIQSCSNVVNLIVAGIYELIRKNDLRRARRIIFNSARQLEFHTVCEVYCGLSEGVASRTLQANDNEQSRHRANARTNTILKFP